jgi:hypothetical protein
MVAPSKRERMMPRRGVAYEYACVMYLAQQFEENMRVILFLGDQWGYLPELKLTRKERKTYKDDVSRFLSEVGTCGRLLNALEQAGLVKNRSALANVVSLRNELAHTFLVDADFDAMDDEKERLLIKRLHRMAVSFYGVVTVTRQIREKFERESALSQSILNQMMTDFGLPELAREAPKLERRKKPG